MSSRPRDGVMVGLAAVLAALAVVRLVAGLERLTWGISQYAAVDLLNLHRAIDGWFAGRPVYTLLRAGVYPPASYVILWPLLGWTSAALARWLWALSSLGALGWLGYLVVRASGTATRGERWCWIAFVPAISAVGETVGNGQLGLHVLPALLCGLLVATRRPGGWPAELGAGLSVLVALVKPSLSLPFLWIMAWVAPRKSALLVVGLGYLGLTLAATVFQEMDLPTLWRTCLSRNATAAASYAGYGNVHRLLQALDLTGWYGPVSLLLLGGLGLWTYWHRNCDFWLLLGVVAIVARLWTYHRPYDDVLLLLPAISLYRRAGSRMAGGLFAVLALLLLAPDLWHSWPRPWGALFNTLCMLHWIVCLGFLVGCARQEGQR